ncbi:cytochrome P450 [Xylariomycetidae sp. FL2044]|nr:cytochrome P450 [Xylariomycetidae sp. FL2044]
MIQRIDRHILTVAFSPIQARACDKAMGVGAAGMSIIAGEKKVAEDGYLRSFPRAAAPAVSPGSGLDTLNREAIQVLAASLDRRVSQGTTIVGLYEWTRHEVFAATMEATYGPHNPFRQPDKEKAWFDYEPGIMPLLMDFMPSVFARKSLRARDLMVADLERYFQHDRHLDGSLFVQLREKHSRDFGLTMKDTAHIEIGQIAGSIVNTAPTAFWAIWQVLSDPIVYEDCRKEVSQLVQTDENGVCTIDLAQVRVRCPVLVSTWQEVLRYHGTGIAARIIQEDTLVDDQYLLKKGGVVLMPNGVIHSDPYLWGPTTNHFNHRRFLKTKGRETTRHPAAAFRGFGGGHVLCPGRHFASTEILSFLALLLLRFDVRPVSGQWVQPEKNMVVDRACPLPKKDVQIELTPRSLHKWNVVFSDSGTGINILGEDITQGDN